MFAGLLLVGMCIPISGLHQRYHCNYGNLEYSRKCFDNNCYMYEQKRSNQMQLFHFQPGSFRPYLRLNRVTTLVIPQVRWFVVQTSAYVSPTITCKLFAGGFSLIHSFLVYCDRIRIRMTYGLYSNRSLSDIETADNFLLGFVHVVVLG